MGVRTEPPLRDLVEHSTTKGTKVHEGKTLLHCLGCRTLHSKAFFNDLQLARQDYRSPERVVGRARGADPFRLNALF